MKSNIIRSTGISLLLGKFLLVTGTDFHNCDKQLQNCVRINCCKAISVGQF